MTGDNQQTGGAPNPDGGFTWHPVYAGKTFAQVRKDLADDIGRDQRSHALAINGAEEAEHDSLAIIVELERRWSQYDFDWTESEPDDLASRIVEFEKDREFRKELRSFADYRAGGNLQAQPVSAAPTPERNVPIVPIGIGILAILIAIFVLIVVL